VVRISNAVARIVALQRTRELSGEGLGTHAVRLAPSRALDAPHNFFDLAERHHGAHRSVRNERGAQLVGDCVDSLLA
tara:strand:+ start:291 stop:521 length:231 start_codon:yes stop_codon:yes gene_type:complete